MTADQVRAALGDPEKTAPVESPDGQAEVWTYRISFVGGVRQVQTSSITYTRPNPLTGVEETLSEPVFPTEQALVEQTIELLFFNGQLVEWKLTSETKRTYY